MYNNWDAEIKPAGQNNNLLVLMKCSIAACQGFHLFFILSKLIFSCKQLS